jgi:hypothetical protein
MTTSFGLACETKNSFVSLAIPEPSSQILCRGGYPSAGVFARTPDHIS